MQKAVHLMKINNTDYFYMNSLLPEKECGPKDVETMQNLFNKGIFQLV